MNTDQPTRRATISDVARLAGVSISTVSRVVNGTGPVADETVEHVRKAIDLLHYKPLAAARSLAGRASDTIGMLVPELTGAFFTPLVRGVEMAARDAGYDLLVHLVTGGVGNDDTAMLPLDEHNTDGLIVFNDRLNDQSLRRLAGNGVPLVLLYRTAPADLSIPSIKFQNVEGAREIVEHLIVHHARRRIAYLAGPEGNEDSAQRLNGYRQALEAHGLAWDPHLVEPADYNNHMARAVVERWLLDGVQFDAIFAADDEAAAGAMLALRQAGCNVPDDVAVVGFDDLAFSHLLTPPLTTVGASVEESGIMAGRLLIAQIRDEEVPKLTVLPTKLVIRQSCGCP